MLSSWPVGLQQQLPCAPAGEAAVQRLAACAQHFATGSSSAAGEEGQPRRNAVAAEAAALRLAARSAEAAAQLGRRLLQPPDRIAGKMRAFLAAGWSEAEVESCIEACKGPPSAAEEHLPGTLRQLADAGFSPAQIAGCLSRHRGILSGDPSKTAVTLEWLQTNLHLGSGGKLVAVVSKAPSLLAYSENVLERNMQWWRGMAATPSQLQTLSNSLARQPDMLAWDPESLG